MEILLSSETPIFLFLEHVLIYSDNFTIETPTEMNQLLIIINKIDQIAMNQSNSLFAVKILSNIISRLDYLLLKQESDKFIIITPIHGLYLKHCIISKYYRKVKKSLLTKTPKVDLKKFNISIQDYLLYHHYSGIIHLSLEDFKAAYNSFGYVLIAPAHVPSLIIIDAYKKYILISLILYGKLNPINYISRSIKMMVSNYTEFVELFEKGDDFTSLIRLTEKYNNNFQEDGNLGLIDYCLNSFIEKKAQQFSNTYLTLDIATAYSLLKSSLQDASYKFSKYHLNDIKNFELLLFQMSMKNMICLGIDKSLNTLNLDHDNLNDILKNYDLETIKNVFFNIKNREMELMKDDKFLRQYLSEINRRKNDDGINAEDK